VIGAAARPSPREVLTERLARRLVAWGTGINTAGAAVVFVYLNFVFRQGDDGPSDELNLVLVVAYTAACGFAASRLLRRGLAEWAASDRPAGKRERDLVLQQPARGMVYQAATWGLAAVLFGALNSEGSMITGLEVGASIALGGLMTSAGVYLVIERQMRPVVALALSSSPPPEAGTLGVGPRILLTWVLVAGVPLIGIVLLAVADEPRDPTGPIVFVVGVALVVGALALTLAARAVTERVRAVRSAMDAVAAGDLAAAVTVDDASEVGRLQAGFNAMAEGLRERERLRDLFGRQVGVDVAREALERGVALGGQARHVSALFADVIGSTSLAAREPPEHVVAMLNRFFAAVVEVVERHGGLVNKFEGDAALCVFGAPGEQPDHAAVALAAARELRARLQELQAGVGLDAAIGVSSGEAVAGHVGAETRFEYTVIGDPVNEAARLTELAKREPGRVLASAATVREAGPEEARHWSLDGEATLRGRSRPTELARLAAQEA
jgi:adenylate cyclase